MGFSTTYTKVETDFLIQQLEKKTASGYKGDLIKTDVAPTSVGFYGLLETGVYANLGGINATAGKLNFASYDGTAWSKMEVELNAPTGVIEEGNTEAVSGGEVYKDKYVQANYAHIFVDSTGLILAYIDEQGMFHFEPSNQLKDRFITWQKVEEKGTYQADVNNLVYQGIDEEGRLIKPKEELKTYNADVFTDKKIVITSPNVKEKKLNLETIAKGRGVDVPLINSGLTHPKVLFIPNGWNGYKYWMAITPTFGPIANTSAPSSYENPHIFCSNNGIDWIEPIGISNPIDMPLSAPSSSYWSDTDLIIGNDGYLYCIYRGNFMPASYVGKSGDDIRRVVVYKKSKDGINWGDRQYMYSTSDENYGIDSESGIMSPTFFYNGNIINVYDVVKSTTLNPYVGQNQTNYIVHRRSGIDLTSLSKYSNESVVNFKNRPWGNGYDIWHIECVKIGDTFFMLLACGKLNSDYADKLYLSYSHDGWNFTAFEQPISRESSYRSSIICESYNQKEVNFKIYNAESIEGFVSLINLKLKLNKI